MGKTSERRLHVREAVIDRLATWAQAQLVAWRDDPAITPEALRNRFERLEAESPTIFLFDFAAGSVSLRQKTKSWSNAGNSAPELLRRANLYLKLFREVVTGFKLDYLFPLAVDVDDHPSDTSGLPMFAFQKRVGSTLILLPDIDILGADHFVSPDYDDVLAFNDKADAAIFVGATTGANLTREVVETLAMPRLRSAVFFRDSADVTFHLPKIVQYDNEETAALVRALGVSGSPARWKDQFENKYLLSMDGNGATCSRVAIALKSHSVLIKYASDYELFYFDGLKENMNFLLVDEDEDVLDALEWCRRRPLQASSIAQSGRRFALEHLSHLAVLIYVAFLLDEYGHHVGKQAMQQPADVRGTSTLLDCHGHIQNVGDTRAALGGWFGSLGGDQAIEGFALEPGPGIDALDISYQAVLSDGTLSGRSFGYDFCGTRGQNQVLRGACITLKGDAAVNYELNYLVAFADGALIGPTPAGVICRSPGGAKMTGLRLIIKMREPAGRTS